jgi:hypothetical protein
MNFKSLNTEDTKDTEEIKSFNTEDTKGKIYGITVHCGDSRDRHGAMSAPRDDRT